MSAVVWAGCFVLFVAYGYADVAGLVAVSVALVAVWGYRAGRRAQRRAIRRWVA